MGNVMCIALRGERILVPSDGGSEGGSVASIVFCKPQEQYDATPHQA